jgi:hypothetical protein
MRERNKRWTYNVDDTLMRKEQSVWTHTCAARRTGIGRADRVETQNDEHKLYRNDSNEETLKEYISFQETKSKSSESSVLKESPQNDLNKSLLTQRTCH